MANRPTFEMSPLGSSDPGWSDAQGCATPGLVVGAVVVAAGLLLGWVLLNTPDYASVGPGIGFFGLVLLSVSALVGVLLGLFWLVHFRPGKGAAARTVAVVLGLFGVAALAVSAPWTPAKTYFTPEIVGVVATSSYTPDGVDHVTLVDGRAFDVDDRRQSDDQPSTAGHYSLLSGGRGIEVGGLLLASEHPTPWYSGTNAPYDETGAGWSGVCYAFDGAGVERQDSVDMTTGLRLTKAPDYPNDDAVGFGFQGRVCLNALGQATSVFGGA